MTMNLHDAYSPKGCGCHGCLANAIMISQSQDFVHVNYHGSVLVQSLLRYQNPSLLSSHLLRLGEEMLLTLALHPSGSHVIEAFLGSRTVLTKHRQKLVKLFKVSLSSNI